MQSKLEYNTGMKKWTLEQLEFLRRHYNEMPLDELCIKLDRSENSVVAKVYYLRKRGWTFTRRTDAKC
jgi:hypothetical protein